MAEAAGSTGRRVRPGVTRAIAAGAVLLLVLTAGAVTAGILLAWPTPRADANGAPPTDSLIPEGPVTVGMGVSVTPAAHWSAFAQEDDSVLLYSDELVDYAGLQVTVGAAPPGTIEEALAADIRRSGAAGAAVAPARAPEAWDGERFDQALSVRFECPAASATCERPLVGTYTLLFDTVSGRRAFVVYTAPDPLVLDAHRDEVDRMIESLG